MGGRRAARDLRKAAQSANLPPEIEVENFIHIQKTQEWLAGNEDRRRLAQEFQEEQQRIDNDLAVPDQRLFLDDCPICTINEADHLITCCGQFLCLSCIRNMNIPRVVDDIAIPLHLCPFCREGNFIAAPRMPDA